MNSPYLSDSILQLHFAAATTSREALPCACCNNVAALRCQMWGHSEKFERPDNHARIAWATGSPTLPLGLSFANEYAHATSMD